MWSPAAWNGSFVQFIEWPLSNKEKRKWELRKKSESRLRKWGIIWFFVWLVDWLLTWRDYITLAYIQSIFHSLISVLYLFIFFIYENQSFSTEIYLTSRVYLSSEWIIFLLFFLCDCISLWRESWPFFMTFLYALSPHLGPNCDTWTFS